jgi:hypothetical protein
MVLLVQTLCFKLKCSGPLPENSTVIMPLPSASFTCIQRLVDSDPPLGTFEGLGHENEKSGTQIIVNIGGFFPAQTLLSRAR